jgi:hypothetical protein
MYIFHTISPAKINPFLLCYVVSTYFEVNMKNIAILTMLLLSFKSLAQTELEIPIFSIEPDQSIEYLNEKLVIKYSDDSIKENRNHFWEIYKDFRINDIIIPTDFPGGMSDGVHKTCYRGDAAEAVKIASLMGDSIYSDQLGIWGWKYQDEVHLIDAKNESSLARISSEWKNFQGSDDSILILSHENDDATDFNAGIIVKCEE